MNPLNSQINNINNEIYSNIDYQQPNGINQLEIISTRNSNLKQNNGLIINQGQSSNSGNNSNNNNNTNNRNYQTTNQQVAVSSTS